jgi:hypothetical protein
MTRVLRTHLLGIVAATLLGALWLLWRGPVPVVSGSEVLDMTAPFWYMISAFPFFGILLAESWLQWDEKGGRVLLGQALVIFILAALRLALHIPISGHVLLLSFFLLWDMKRLDQPYLTEFLFAAGILALLLYTKVVLWQDTMTAMWGVALAIIIWSVGQKLSSVDVS